jgi:hypothetical protein
MDGHDVCSIKHALVVGRWQQIGQTLVKCTYFRPRLLDLAGPGTTSDEQRRAIGP